MPSKKKTRNQAGKYVFLFDEYAAVMAQLDNDWDAVRGLLGRQGANLPDATPRWSRGNSASPLWSAWRRRIFTFWQTTFSPVL